jgi:hypothetical protein
MKTQFVSLQCLWYRPVNRPSAELTDLPPTMSSPQPRHGPRLDFVDGRRESGASDGRRLSEDVLPDIPRAVLFAA